MAAYVAGPSIHATILDNGQVKRHDVPPPYDQPSGKWIITGAVRLNNFGYVVETFTLADVLSGHIQWEHKNGKQRVYLTDNDHGTRRVWMRPHTVWRQ